LLLTIAGRVAYCSGHIGCTCHWSLCEYTVSVYCSCHCVNWWIG